jgi:tetratricopeptide (TPR) repeat protein
MTIKSTAQELKHLLAKGDFDKALGVLSEIEKTRPLTPHELVVRSRCNQLSSGTKIPPLEEAKKALQQALESDDEYVPAILDLAWYYHAVEDNPRKALPLFERAYELSRQNLIESITGKVEALEELESPKEAMRFFRNALHKTVRPEDFDDEKRNGLCDEPDAPSPD